MKLNSPTVHPANSKQETLTPQCPRPSSLQPKDLKTIVSYSDYSNYSLPCRQASSSSDALSDSSGLDQGARTALLFTKTSRRPKRFYLYKTKNPETRNPRHAGFKALKTHILKPKASQSPPCCPLTEPRFSGPGSFRGCEAPNSRRKGNPELKAKDKKAKVI